MSSRRAGWLVLPTAGGVCTCWSSCGHCWLTTASPPFAGDSLSPYLRRPTALTSRASTGIFALSSWLRTLMGSTRTPPTVTSLRKPCGACFEAAKALFPRLTAAVSAHILHYLGHQGARCVARGLSAWFLF